MNQIAMPTPGTTRQMIAVLPPRAQDSGPSASGQDSLKEMLRDMQLLAELQTLELIQQQGQGGGLGGLGGQQAGGGLLQGLEKMAELQMLRQVMGGGQQQGGLLQGLEKMAELQMLQQVMGGGGQQQGGGIGALMQELEMLQLLQQMEKQGSSGGVPSGGGAQPGVIALPVDFDRATQQDA